MKAEWTSLPLDAFVERHTVKNAPGDTNVLTISARHGLVSQREFFNKQVASKDLGHYFLLARGDFAYNKSYSDGYPVGAIKRLDKYANGVVSPLYICFRLKSEERVCSDFLVQYFEAGLLEGGLRSIAKEGARNHGLLNVKPSEFFALPVQLPPLGEQKKIAAILSSVDEAIEAMQAVIDQLQVVKKAMIAELLTRGLPGRHARFKQTEIGEVPETWEIVSVGECVRSGLLLGHQDGNHGGDYPRKNEFGLDGIPFLSAKHLDEFHNVDVVSAPRLPEARAHKLRIGFAKTGDVLLAHNATVGPVGIVPPWSGTVLLGTSLTYYRPAPGRLDTSYLAAFLAGASFQEQLTRVMKQSTRNQVPITRQRELLLAVPPDDEQHKIGMLFRRLLARLAADAATLAASKALKTSLMSVLLTGDVRVKPDEDAA